MTSLKVTGMHCEGCENSIQNKLEEIKNVSNVRANRKKEMVEFETDGSDETLTAIAAEIEELGYKVEY